MSKKMQIKKMQRVTSWFVVLSEVSHVFCCVIPSIFSILTILAGMGAMSALPLWMVGAHDAIHGWELTIIITSGVILAFGWLLQIISKRIDCHDTGCVHEPCGKKKKSTTTILKIATALFIINITIYVTVHMHQQRHEQAETISHIEDVH